MQVTEIRQFNPETDLTKEDMNRARPFFGSLLDDSVLLTSGYAKLFDGASSALGSIGTGQSFAILEHKPRNGVATDRTELFVFGRDGQLLLRTVNEWGSKSTQGGTFTGIIEGELPPAGAGLKLIRELMEHGTLKQLRKEFYDRLMAAASELPADAVNIGSGRLANYRKLGMGDTSSEPRAFTATLGDTAYALARGELKLTPNSGAYHEFRSPSPSQALRSLEKIVSRAGFPCAIETQANIRVSNPNDSVLKELEKFGAEPLGIQRTFFTLSGAGLEEAVLRLRFLPGVTVELWPALVSKAPHSSPATLPAVA